jgi:hypothetical protein
VSYRQTVFAYPSGGGAYIVAEENLGQTAGLLLFKENIIVTNIPYYLQ